MTVRLKVEIECEAWWLLKSCTRKVESTAEFRETLDDQAMTISNVALPSGWVLRDGSYYCPDHAEGT